jgi:hypothetical protein
MCNNIRITMNVRVIDRKKGTVYLPTEEYVCVVQPPPHCYDRPQVLAIQAEAMAKIKFVNSMYSRLVSERDIKQRLGGRDWTIDVIVTKQEVLEDALA